jgi:hypothetical protein
VLASDKVVLLTQARRSRPKGKQTDITGFRSGAAIDLFLFLHLGQEEKWI